MMRYHIRSTVMQPELFMTHAIDHNSGASVDSNPGQFRRQILTYEVKLERKFLDAPELNYRSIIRLINRSIDTYKFSQHELGRAHRFAHIFAYRFSHRYRVIIRSAHRHRLIIRPAHKHRLIIRPAHRHSYFKALAGCLYGNEVLSGDNILSILHLTFRPKVMNEHFFGIIIIWIFSLIVILIIYFYIVDCDRRKYQEEVVFIDYTLCYRCVVGLLIGILSIGSVKYKTKLRVLTILVLVVIFGGSFHNKAHIYSFLLKLAGLGLVRE
eukprot:450124_1